MKTEREFLGELLASIDFGISVETSEQAAHRLSMLDRITTLIMERLKALEEHHATHAKFVIEPREVGELFTRFPEAEGDR